MNLRHALIVIVPENKCDRKLNLDIVRNDAKILRDALQKLGYKTTCLGLDAVHDTSLNSIRTALRTSCQNAPSDGTLLVFFSGHGVHFNGRDYLIPWDADLQDTENLERYLLPVNIAEYVDKSPAKEVILFVDACREGLDLTTKALSLTSWGEGIRQRAKDRMYAIVYACEPGQFAYYVKGKNGYSYFSKALAQVLTIQHSARTLKEVCVAAQGFIDDYRSAENTGSAKIKMLSRK